MLPGLTTLARLRTILLALGLSTLLALGGCDRLAQPPTACCSRPLGCRLP
ncbi:hypothetical protein [Cyanobium sp. ATX-6F1]